MSSLHFDSNPCELPFVDIGTFIEGLSCMWQPGCWQTTPDVLWQVTCPCGKQPVANVTPRTGAEDGNVDWWQALS